MIASLLLAALLGLAGEPASHSAHEVASVELGAGAEELARVHVWMPGLLLGSPGGLARFSGLPLRRTAILASPIVVDGAELAGGIAGPLESSPLALEGTRLVVQRGFAPIQLGPSPLAGALELVGRVHEGPRRGYVELGLGSLMSHELRGQLSLALRPGLSLRTGVEQRGTLGNFRHFDDGGTRYLFGDDARRRRASNATERVGASLRLDHRRGRLSASTLLFGHWQLGDVPAPNRARASHADFASAALRSISRVRRDFAGRGGQTGYVEWVLNVGSEGRRFRDPRGSLAAVADDERLLALDLASSPRLRVPVWRQAHLTISGDLRGELVDVRDRVTQLDPAQASSGDARRGRVSVGAGIELEQWLWARRWALMPGLRADLVVSRFRVPAGEGEVDDRGRRRGELGIGPRLATTFVLRETSRASVVMHGSVGRSMRAPSLTELFGDRGWMRGNEGLRSEASSKVDGGLRLVGRRPRGGLDLATQLTGFAAWSEDAIHWVRDEQRVVSPVNLERTRVRGLELGTSVRMLAGDLVFDLVYALVDARNIAADQHGQRLPGHALHNLWLRASGGHAFESRRNQGVGLEPRFFYELDLASVSFVDIDNRDVVPARLLHALGLSLRVGARLRLAAELRGLSHRYWAEVTPGGWPGAYPAANADALGTPLPGPSVWTSVRFDL